MKYLKLFEASDNFSVKDIDWEEDMKTLEPKINKHLNGILKKIGSSISFGRTRDFKWSSINRNRLVLDKDIFTKDIEIVEEAGRQYELINYKIEDMLDHLNFDPVIILYCSNDGFNSLKNKIEFCLRMDISSFEQMYNINEQFIPRIESLGCKRKEIVMKVEGRRRLGDGTIPVDGVLPTFGTVYKAPNGLDYTIWLKFTIDQ